MKRKPKTKISYSEASCFRQCKLKWYFEHVMGLTPKKPAWALLLGTAVHAGLEGFYKPISPQSKFNLTFEQRCTEGIMAYHNEWKKLLDRIPDEIWGPEMQDLADENILLGQGMLEHYFGYAKYNDDFTVLATEQYLLTPIGNPNGHRTMCRLAAKVDMIVQTPDERIWVWENKTCSQFYSEFEMDISDQVTRYAWAVEKNYPQLELAGIIYNNIRKLQAGPPDVLKNGRLSRAKDVSCSYDQYVDALVEADQDPDDEFYKDFLDYLKTRDDPFIQRHKTYRSQNEIASMEAQMFGEYKDRLDTVRFGRFYRSTTRDCSWSCPYVELCKATYDDGDTDFIIATDFIREEG